MGREGRKGRGTEGRGGKEGREWRGREGSPPIFYCTPSSFSRNMPGGSAPDPRFRRKGGGFAP